MLRFKIIGIFIGVLFTTTAFSQDWYNQLKSEHKRARFGIGVVGSDPLGLSIEIFKGEFCSNGNGYKTATIWMLNLGVEEILKMPDLMEPVDYAGEGEVRAGGLRAEFGLLMRLFSINPDKVTIQMHFGPTFEGGTRNYLSADNINEVSTTDFAANGRVRLTITSSGISVGQGLMFVSFDAGLKYHYVLNETYSYLRPTFGITFRKVR